MSRVRVVGPLPALGRALPAFGAARHGPGWLTQTPVAAKLRRNSPHIGCVRSDSERRTGPSPPVRKINSSGVLARGQPAFPQASELLQTKGGKNE